ncbi:hypothetical protein H0H93_012572 [Arthromyces matolae]|nr:hypothetical protein H0H93_012572 [Arthromyces matolae]
MDNLKDLFDTIPPGYQWPAQFCIAMTLVTWVASLITSNVSQVDRLWTFLPFIYSAYYALLPLWPLDPLFFLCPFMPKSLGWAAARDFSPRAVLMLVLIFVWMLRLSYNTYRRGLFKLQDEDYRWAVLRSKVSPFLFQVINLTFIAATQNVLLLLLGIPTKTASTLQPHTSLVASDYILATLALIDLAFEFTSDNQQWAFHQYKHAYLASEKEKGTSKVEPYDKLNQWLGARLDFTPADAKRGFITRGLWAYSRHPNFLCEQSFWWIITLMPLLSRQNPLYIPFPWHLVPSLSAILHGFPYTLYPLISHLSGPVNDLLPALALSLLFFSSTLFTESISAGKYPKEYKAYQERVGMFSPLRTWEKGLVLAWRGRKKHVEEIVWGSRDKDKKE